MSDRPKKEWNRNRQCSLDGCERKHCAKGLCRKHYEWADRNPGKPIPLLTAKAAAAGTNLVLSWTVYATNFQLKSSPILPATTWGAVTDVISLQAEQGTVTKSIAENARYYRLIRQ